MGPIAPDRSDGDDLVRWRGRWLRALRLPLGSFDLGDRPHGAYGHKLLTFRSRERWKYTLEHFIAGTEGVPGFGDMFIDKIQVAHVLSWKTGIAKLIAAGHYSPTTANGWLAILRVITKAAKRELGLPTDASEGVTYFDTSEHQTYTEEEPNALAPERVGEFLACMREVYPQHYAMTSRNRCTTDVSRTNAVGRKMAA